MSCITPENVMKCSKSFLVANFYAKSKFNEDSLMNLSIEASEGKITGSIKIRAKTKGMADCLKEKFSQIQQSLGNI